MFKKSKRKTASFAFPLRIRYAGGDLAVLINDDQVTLVGPARKVFEGIL